MGGLASGPPCPPDVRSAPAQPGRSSTVDIAVALPGDGRIQLVSRYFFEDPEAEVCRQLVRRLFEVEEVRAIEVVAARAWAQIEYTNGVVPSREVVGKIARRLQNGRARTRNGDAPRELPAVVDGARGWRVERHGTRLSTWEVRHELPGRIRVRNRSIRRNQAACRALEAVLGRTRGVVGYETRARTATVLVRFDTGQIQRDQLLQILDRALAEPPAGDVGPAEPGARGGGRPRSAADQSYNTKPQRGTRTEFAITAGALTLAIAGALFYPPLGWLGVPPQLYIHRGLYASAVRLLVRQRKITVDALSTGLGVAALLHGYLVLFAVGNAIYLCTKSVLDKVKRDSRADFTDVFRQQARTVWVRVDGVEIEMPLDAVTVGDVVAIATGQTVPVDGRVVEGAAAVDQHVMTGEAIPAEKGVGDPVLALTVVLSGKIYVRVEKTGSATAAAHIAHVLDQTVDFKTGRQLRAEHLSERLVIPALVSGLFTWPAFGISAGVAVLDSHPKYKTTLASSIGLLNHFKLAARQGLLIKDGRTLELLNEVDTVVFDKTGTLTLAQPHLARLHVCAPHTGPEVLGLAAAAEQHQAHPIAAAILHAARARGLSVPRMTEADYRVGYGLTVTVDGATVRVGSMRFMEMEAVAVPPAMADVQARCHEEGHSLVVVAVDGAVAGALELHTSVRPEARSIVVGLRRRGITSMYIISGDHEAPTRRLAEALGIERYFAETLPENKAALIEGLQQAGKTVCYVGDGINDSIALKQAHVSVSLRGASTVATDTAEVVLLDGTLAQLCALFDLARACNRNMRITMGAVILPSLVCVAGVLLGSFAFMESRVLNYISLGGGVGAAMTPLMTSPGAPRRTPARPPEERAADGRVEECTLA